MGIPIIVQPSQAEKNRAGQVAKSGALAAAMATANPGPMKLYIGSLHFNITEDMLRGIFEPFGRVDEIILMKDHDTGRSKGFGFITVRSLFKDYITFFLANRIIRKKSNHFAIFAPSFTREKMLNVQWNS